MTEVDHTKWILDERGIFGSYVGKEVSMRNTQLNSAAYGTTSASILTDCVTGI
jgi:hypothetical protein